MSGRLMLCTSEVILVFPCTKFMDPLESPANYTSVQLNPASYAEKDNVTVCCRAAQVVKLHECRSDPVLGMVEIDLPDEVKE